MHEIFAIGVRKSTINQHDQSINLKAFLFLSQAMDYFKTFEKIALKLEFFKSQEHNYSAVIFFSVSHVLK